MRKIYLLMEKNWQQPHLLLGCITLSLPCRSLAYMKQFLMRWQQWFIYFCLKTRLDKKIRNKACSSSSTWNMRQTFNALVMTTFNLHLLMAMPFFPPKCVYTNAHCVWQNLRASACASNTWNAHITAGRLQF